MDEFTEEERRNLEKTLCEMEDEVTKAALAREYSRRLSFIPTLYGRLSC